MGLIKPKPKTLTDEQMNSVLAASSQQTGKSRKITTLDPNFPLFEVLVNDKALVYVPDYTVVNPNGESELMMDKAAFHNIVHKNEYLKIRCANGIVEDSLGFDGTCPLCEATSESWDLVNMEWEAAAKRNSFDPGDDKKLHQAEWDSVRSGMAVSNPAVYVTFPIVVIDTIVDAEGKHTNSPKKDENGNISYKCYFYTVSHKKYEEVWLKSLEQYGSDDPDADIPTSPAGCFVTLDYTYQVKPNTQPSKMESAKALSVIYKTWRNNAAWDEIAKALDEEFRAFTPRKAVEVLVDNQIYDMEELQNVTDSVMKSTRDKLALYNISSQSLTTAVSSAEQALESFGAKPAELETSKPEGGATPPVDTEEVPQAGVVGI